MKNIYGIIIYGKYRKLKNRNHTFSKKTLVLSIICNKYGSKNGKIFKEESLEISKIIDLIINIGEYQDKCR